jgi:1,2-diacylglycerol 3-beta-galactosyltransferase
MMHASDLIICKAGGLIVTESLACGLPMILIDIIPGQETGNAEYVTALGAADLAETPVAVLEGLSHLIMHDQALLHQRAENAKRIGQPRSAYKVASILFEAVKDRPVRAESITRRSHRHSNSAADENEQPTWMP